MWWLWIISGFVVCFIILVIVVICAVAGKSMPTDYYDNDWL
jgi:hypothetical protein